jgi:hypothetical protein
MKEWTLEGDLRGQLERLRAELAHTVRMSQFDLEREINVRKEAERKLAEANQRIGDLELQLLGADLKRYE